MLPLYMDEKNKRETVEYTELRNKQFPIEKFLFGQEDTYEDIKEMFKCSDDVMAKAIEYDIKKEPNILNELQEMIKNEQEQLKEECKLLQNIEKLNIN
jgi:hypothetical protein